MHAVTRLALFILVLVACVGTSTAVCAQDDEPEMNPFTLAAKILSDGKKDIKQYYSYKEQDINDIRITITKAGGSSDAIKSLRTLMNNNKLAAEGDNPTANEMTDLIVAIWLRWKVNKILDSEPKLESIVGNLKQFVRVRFQSTAAKATVFVDDIDKGQTQKDVFLSTQGVYNLKMTRPNNPDWKKPNYTPPAKGEDLSW